VKQYGKHATVIFGKRKGFSIGRLKSLMKKFHGMLVMQFVSALSTKQ
jgi:hypothetical protein